MKRYVIGDVHGCSDQLMSLLDAIFNDIGPNDPASYDWKMIFVGDYVDRGPQVAGCIQIVRGLQNTYGDKVVALMGNHEDMLLMGEYLYARETLASFVDRVIPEDVSLWMQKLPKYYEDDTIIVTHAAAKPGVPMEHQDDEWLMWMRYPIMALASLGKHLYHGHTPVIDGPEQVEDRTNVDTGCVFGGFLTAAVVGEDGKPEKFIQVRNELYS